MGIIIEAFKQTFLHVPRDGVDRKEAALVPRLSHEIWNVRVSEIKDGMEAREVVGGRQQPKNYGDDQKPNKSR